MKSSIPLALALLLSTLSLLSSFAMAQTVYKTVENGVTVFSDSPPTEGTAEVLTLETPPPAPDGLYEKRLADMRETTDRMAASRQERELGRLELRKAQREAQRASDPAPPSELAAQPGIASWTGNYWPTIVRPPGGVPPYPGYRPNRPAQPPYPARPYRPYSPLGPQRVMPATPPPGWSVMKPGNAQLMRPLVSGRK